MSTVADNPTTAANPSPTDPAIVREYIAAGTLRNMQDALTWDYTRMNDLKRVTAAIGQGIVPQGTVYDPITGNTMIPADLFNQIIRPFPGSTFGVQTTETQAAPPAPANQPAASQSPTPAQPSSPQPPAPTAAQVPPATALPVTDPSQSLLSKLTPWIGSALVAATAGTAGYFLAPSATPQPAASQSAQDTKARVLVYWGDQQLTPGESLSAQVNATGTTSSTSTAPGGGNSP